MTLRDEDVPGLVRDLGLPGLFDVHVHFMPPAILQAVWAYFDAAGPKLGRPWPITYRGTDDERVAQLRALGVSRFSALSYAHKPGVAEFMNDWGRDFAADKPDCLWSGTFFPEPSAAEYVPRLVEDGVEVFKAHVQVGEFDPRDPLLDPVWETLQASGTPVVLHAGSGPMPGEHTGPQQVADVLRRYPDLTLVIAHLGMPESHEFLALAADHPNVHLDTTMVWVDFFGTPHDPTLLPKVVELQDRILLGTDFPNIPYPYAHQVESLVGLDLGRDWLRDVLWHNGARLFGLEGPAGE